MTFSRLASAMKAARGLFLSVSLLLACVMINHNGDHGYNGLAIALTLPTGTGAVRTRKEFVQSLGWSAAAGAAACLVGPSSSIAAVPATEISPKRTNLGDEELKKVVESDILQNQFLATGQLTRDVYDESATFTDEIDTYTLDKWIVGTQRLFNGDNSSVRLVGDIDVSKEKVEFRFDEDLQFNIPFRPTVSLTGKVVLARDTTTGLITSYQEFWDQDVVSVLKTAKF